MNDIVSNVTTLADATTCSDPPDLVSIIDTHTGTFFDGKARFVNVSK